MSSLSTQPTEASATILVVDDTAQNLMILGELLKAHYRVRAANSGTRGLQAAANEPRPDLILLDVMMPDMDGHEVLRRLRSEPATQDIPVIFITAMSGTDDEKFGLDLGAVDYITKPFNPNIVLTRVRTQLELKEARDRLARQNDWLESEVTRRMRENLLVQELSVRALSCLAEARDNETGLHIVRTQSFVELLARKLANNPRFSEALAGNRFAMVVKAAPLHDIGKVGIPDAILLKPGKLTTEEFQIMKSHPTIGAEAIGKAMNQALAGSDEIAVEQALDAFSFLQIASEISLGHHEKWDGGGYPAGLAGDAIPASARLMALADVFDALTCHRVYKPAMPFDKARSIIVEGRGSHFDPDVVDTFLDCQDEFIDIATRLADPETLAERSAT